MAFMSLAKKKGDYGEKLAAAALSEKGYRILVLNYRCGRNEIDIIAEKDGVLVFVEVKARKNSRFGFPEDFVDERKAELITTAAEHYILETGWKKDIRFDIVSILMGNDGHEIQHFEDAFY
jgi:putative endonuclease